MSEVARIIKNTNEITHLSKMLSKILLDANLDFEHIAAHYNFDSNSVKLEFKITIPQKTRLGKKAQILKEQHLMTPFQIHKKWEIIINDFDQTRNLAESNSNIVEELDENYNVIHFAKLHDYSSQEFILRLIADFPYLNHLDFIEIGYSKNPSRNITERYQIVANISNSHISRQVYLKRITHEIEIPFEKDIFQILPRKIQDSLKMYSRFMTRFKELEEGTADEIIGLNKISKKIEKLTNLTSNQIFEGLNSSINTIKRRLEQNFLDYFYIEPNGVSPEPTIIKCATHAGVNFQMTKFLINLKVFTKIKFYMTSDNPWINFFVIFDKDKLIKDLKQEIKSKTSKPKRKQTNKPHPKKQKKDAQQKLKFTRL